MKSRRPLCPSMPMIWLMMLVLLAACGPGEHGRLENLGFTGASTDWRVVSARAVGKEVGDDQVIAAVPDLLRVQPIYLNLSTQPVSDRCIPAILQVKSLQTLDLSGTDVTSDGLQQLSGLPNLKLLYISVPNFHPEELQALAAALPGVNIQDNWRATEERRTRDQNN
jgi:hypothetical protein